MEKEKDILSHLKKRDRPEIPSDYFSELSSTLLTEIKKEPKKKSIPLYKNPVIWISSIAASLILIISIYTINSIPLKNEINFSSLTPSEIEAYVNSNIDDFDEALLIEVLENNITIINTDVIGDTNKRVQSAKPEINSQSKVSKNSPVSFESLTREEILNYLNEQEISEEELEESIDN